ncbi:hypothetical protein [Maridesulfovibrio sp.]|uniref:hypothetical protein n=1 Tax=Maridesulfovibrio sp. TaxID=2795000 RepID=UPI0029C9FA82|nr:hypothetical protein [Maridesulfovibrio sp.]
MKDNQDKGYVIILCMGFLIIAAALFAAIFFLHHIADYELPKYAQIGSFLGGTIGPIFSVAATVFFIGALYLQRKTLESQIGISKQQSFEITFFNLIKTIGATRNQKQDTFTNYLIEQIALKETPAFINYTNKERIEYLGKNYDRIADHIKKTSIFTVSTASHSLYKSFIMTLRYINENRTCINSKIYIEILCASLAWDEIRFCIYYPILRPNLANDFALVKNSNLTIPVGSLYRKDHADWFKSDE